MTRRRWLLGLGLTAAFLLCLATAEAADRPKGPPCNGTVKKVDGQMVMADCPELWTFHAGSAAVILNNKPSTLGELQKKGKVEVTIYWRKDRGTLYADKIVWPAEPLR
jgi:hypothetical protein